MIIFLHPVLERFITPGNEDVLFCKCATLSLLLVGDSCHRRVVFLPYVDLCYCPTLISLLFSLVALRMIIAIILHLEEL